MKPLFAVLLALTVLITVPSVYAQPLPDLATATNTPTPPPINTPVPIPPAETATPTPASNPQALQAEGLINCDACGYCNGMALEKVPQRWQNCRRCLYPAFGKGDINPLDNQTIKKTQDIIPQADMYHMYTDFGCISTKPNEFVAQVSTFFFSLVGGLAFLFFIYGAGVVATSRSDPGRLNRGRRIIFGSIAGLLFALFAVFLMRFIASTIGTNLGG